MRLAFMGTPAFSIPALSELIAAGHDIAGVYTRKARPAGRGQELRPSPVQAFAETHRLTIHTPGNFKAPAEIEAFRVLDLDAAIVVAYGLILPRAILEAPRFGCFNLHASLLPRWRGAAPINRAIMAGDTITGAQVMRMEEGLDTGPILLSESVEITDADTAGTLHDRLAQIGASLLPRVLAAVERGVAIETPQPADGVIYAAKISAAEARIDWSEPAAQVDRRIRGLAPHPGAWFEAPSPKGPQRVKALMSRIAKGKGAPGEILRADDQLVVACGGGAVEIVLLQRAGKAAQAPSDFLRGFRLDAGARI